MNNVELEEKILEFIKEDNYFEMITKAKAFESEYKKSDFYKITKKPLDEVIRESKIYYALQFRDMANNLQRLINSLSLEKILDLINQAADMFEKENEDMTNTLEAFKNLKS